MTGSQLEGLDGFILQRATDADRDDVEALQACAYAHNRALLGVEPVPLLADYAERFRVCEVWIFRPSQKLQAVLMLETAARDDVLIWSVATDPGFQQAGFGRHLLAAAEQRCRELGRTVLRLYTGEALHHLVDWYARNGYEIERRERLPDRTLVHMIKRLAD